MTTLKQRYWRLVQRCETAAQLADLAWLAVRNRLAFASLLDSKGPALSLTSHGSRIGTAYLTVESIARGQARPARIMLWLDDDDALANLPATLRRQVARGLEVRASENFGPHTKYFPYIDSEDDFSRPLVTADDDVIYPRPWLRELLAHHALYPDEVVCHRARVVVFDGAALAPYNNWPMCASTAPSLMHLATGVSGVLYPVAMQRALKQAGRAFLACCPKADDLWLHVTAVRSGARIRQLRSAVSDFPCVPASQHQALCLVNMGEGLNDVQARATYLPRDLQLMQHANP